MNRITRILVLLVLSMATATVMAQGYKQVNDISYTQKPDAYSLERLKLDIYHPEGSTDCPVVVWFHGGGLEGGNKEIPAQLKEKDIVVVAHPAIWRRPSQDCRDRPLGRRIPLDDAVPG